MPSTQVTRETEHIGDTRGAANHDHDMVHELSKRLDSLWRSDQYIANAEDHPQVRKFWERIQEQERSNVDRLKQLIAEHVKKGCF